MSGRASKDEGTLKITASASFSPFENLGNCGFSGAFDFVMPVEDIDPQGECIYYTAKFTSTSSYDIDTLVHCFKGWNDNDAQLNSASVHELLETHTTTELSHIEFRYSPVGGCDDFRVDYLYEIAGNKCFNKLNVVE